MTLAIRLKKEIDDIEALYYYLLYAGLKVILSLVAKLLSIHVK
ncbi:hypothetical protein [Terribacillus aidingensis]